MDKFMEKVNREFNEALAKAGMLPPKPRPTDTKMQAGVCKSGGVRRLSPPRRRQSLSGQMSLFA